MYNEGQLKNTVVILLADHGMKYGSFFNTPTGKMENLRPLLYLIFPNSMLDSYPMVRLSLEHNKNKLITHHDLHVTMKHLAVYPEIYTSNNSYSRTLLEPIPERDCEQCAIPANWCLCYS